ncbi:hypothetical protein N7471_010251 [Penicillium samsonianum]|uniref:uncharacterized protein n=1 Tax=Penicillium samsonianum TaxID=1882272 RepID=UPI002546DBCA|nr:uncharacterized protein N7471_010251 [Penicillium samsonianum]KAJ6129034.1 hypothetical protein N7471_010251 [Penicillium samsonianum]
MPEVCLNISPIESISLSLGLPLRLPLHEYLRHSAAVLLDAAWANAELGYRVPTWEIVRMLLDNTNAPSPGLEMRRFLLCMRKTGPDWIS